MQAKFMLGPCELHLVKEIVAWSALVRRQIIFPFKLEFSLPASSAYRLHIVCISFAYRLHIVCENVL